MTVSHCPLSRAAHCHLYQQTKRRLGLPCSSCGVLFHRFSCSVLVFSGSHRVCGTDRKTSRTALQFLRRHRQPLSFFLLYCFCLWFSTRSHVCVPACALTRTCLSCTLYGSACCVFLQLCCSFPLFPSCVCPSPRGTKMRLGHVLRKIPMFCFVPFRVVHVKIRLLS